MSRREQEAPSRRLSARPKTPCGGLVAEPEFGMTVADLRNAPRDPSSCTPLTNFVLVITTIGFCPLGDHGGFARIIDPPDGVRLVPYSELLARWDSVALVISDRNMSTAPLWFRHSLTATLAAFLAVGLAIIGASRKAALPIKSYIRAHGRRSSCFNCDRICISLGRNRRHVSKPGSRSNGSTIVFAGSAAKGAPVEIGPTSSGRYSNGRGCEARDRLPSWAYSWGCQCSSYSIAW